MTDRQIENLRSYTLFLAVANVVLQIFHFIFNIPPLAYPISYGAFFLFILYCILATQVLATTKIKTLDWICAIAWLFVFVLIFPVFR